MERLATGGRGHLPSDMVRATQGIAIVGLACEYPDAHGPAELWQNVLARRRAFRRFPRERLDLADYGSADRGSPDLTYGTQGAFLEGWSFDRVGFRVAGRAFRSADLVHWLALDVAARALADAGAPEAEGLARETTGVVVGNTLTGEFSRAGALRLRWPYVRRVVAAALAAEGRDGAEAEAFLDRLEGAYKEPFPELTEESLAGGLSNTIAGRICNHFDLHGGGFTVDGACASSLLAVAQACSALAAGDLDAALAGGVDLSLDPFELVGFARTGALAGDDMRVYDAASEGFFPGEGCGFAVLLREEDALAQGRRIYAVIRGWGVSSDGAGGITRPDEEGQALALARAYRRAGFGIDSVGYFEGHGTGTPVGDAIELAALAGARRAADPEAPPAPEGSVKALIGHTKAAAGVAGLIKATMALHHRLVPPNAGCRTPHPLLAAEGAALRLEPRGGPWPAGRPLRAAVSAMGFGGINAHVVLEGEERAERRALSRAERTLLASAQDAELFFLAATDGAALAAQVATLAAVAGRLSRAELADAAAELARRAAASAGRVRAAIVAATPAELEERAGVLAGLLAEGRARVVDPRRGVFLGAAGTPPRIGLLFPGQGAPAHREGGAWAVRFEEVAALYRRAKLPAGAGADTADTALAQPAIATAELAALAALERLGMRAAVAVGHSLGELAALHWAGALDAASLLAVARARGAAMAELGAAGGAMAALGAGAAEVAGLATEAGVAVAAHNGPASTVVSGRAAAVEAAMSAARARGWSAVRLRVSHAFHSPLVAAVAPRVDAALEQIPFAPPRRPVASTVTGGLLAPDADLRRLLIDQLTSPVRFADAVAAAAGAGRGIDLWLEAGPGRALTGLVAELGEGSGTAPVLALDAGGESLAGLLAAAGAAWALGAPVAPGALFDDRFTRPFSFEREPVFLVNPCELGARPAAPFPERASGARAAARTSAPASAELASGAGSVERTSTAPVGRASGVGSDERASGAASFQRASRATASPSRPEEVGVRAAVSEDAGGDAPAAGGDDPLEVVRALVAARAELPSSAIGERSRLLSDLHLNSIAVGQLLAEAARRLGRAAPAAPTEFADATIAEVAEVLAAGPEADAAPERQPAGVDSWVRAFTVEWVEAPPPRPPAADRPAAAPVGAGGASGWRLIAPPGHPLAADLERELAAVGGGGVALIMPPLPVSGCFDECLDLFQAAAPPVLAAAAGGAPATLLVVHEVGGAGGFARTLHLEAPGTTTCVVDVPFAHPLAARWAAAEAAAARGYAEARYDRAGRRRVPELRPLPGLHTDESAPAPDPGLGPEDVVLVTGGGRGIAAECAFELARASGARLALIGRSRPEESPELAANLERLRAAGIAVSYQSADVTDAEELADAVTAAEEELGGAVTAVLHGAGRNEPKLLAELTADDYRRTVEPKLLGLVNVLSLVDPERLRLLVTFGSIIARTGLRGAADYATANEWLTLATERYALANPSCRCLALEWSVWSGIGMGERLGRLEALIGQGITPIAPERGTAMLARLLAAPTTPVAVVVSGRYGDPPAFAAGRRELPLARFLERPRVHVGGVELVVECEVGGDTDPYLDDHVFRGERLLPAVMGLEAMAQAAAALTGETRLPSFEAVELERPVVVPPGETAVLRVAVLERAPGRVDAVLRSGVTGFAVDCFRATLVYGDPPPEAGRRPPPSGPPLRFERDLYGGPPGLFFHRGRFRRIAGYRELSATACVAEIGAGMVGEAGIAGNGAGGADEGMVAGAGRWFGRWLPAELLLGDPGARDAALHGIQACVPHATLLPVAVERITAGRLPSGRPLRLAARERVRRGDLFVYDLEVLTAEGEVLESWRGLTLRAVERNRPPESWQAALLAPYLERRLEELLDGGPHPAVAVEPADGEGAGDRALARLFGGAAAVHRRPDGRPEAAGGRAVSLAHAAELVLAVAGTGAVGCDLEPVRPRPAEDWDAMLGAERGELARRIAAERGEDADAAATRVWAAAEALRKAGLPPDAPLVLGAGAADGWLLLRSGGALIGTQVLPVAGCPEPLAVAVLAPAAA